MSDARRSALAAALAIQKRAARVGFDWPDAAGPREKIAEELRELDAEVARGVGRSREAGNRAEIEEELGDLLFAVVNYARHLGLEPEAALAAANEKFRRRFGYVEDRLAAKGLAPEDVGLALLDALWEEAKCRGRAESDRV